MLKVLIWVVSKDMRYIQNAITILKIQNDGVEIVDNAAIKDISALDNDIDIILAVGARSFGMNKITKAARQLHLPEEKLLGDWIVTIPGFTLKKYRQLQRSRLSIFSKNCFGGLISHTLGLPFLSPFVNMFLSEKDFIRFLHSPRVYLEKKLTLKETKWQTDLKFYYPVVTLGNVDVNMNHYPDFDEAVKIWERRKSRINWYNLFVTMYTADEKILQEFDSLPYGKKVCFVSFKSDLDSAWYINRERRKGLDFWQVVNNFAGGKTFYYDPFDMLLYGKKTPLVDM